jgi:nitrogenase molybdenum-iron protein alpha/beta subunit
VATVELGFPSIYNHCLFERPFLGFQGFLAFVDSIVNATRRQELVAANRRRERDPARGA